MVWTANVAEADTGTRIHLGGHDHLVLAQPATEFRSDAFIRCIYGVSTKLNAHHRLDSRVSVILALLLTDYSISMIAVVGMIVLAWTQSLRCVTKDGLYVDCNLCGTEIPDDSSHQLYRCDPYADGFRTALSGFSNDVNWLVFAAFHIGKAVEITKLGHRLSLWMIRLLGRSYLGLGYAIYLSEIILGPFIPSNTARGGGIVMPIALSLSRTLDRDGSMNIAEVGGYIHPI